jgi:hypothetical protein
MRVPTLRGTTMRWVEIVVCEPKNFERISKVTGESIEELHTKYAADWKLNQVRFVYIEKSKILKQTILGAIYEEFEERLKKDVVL